MPYIQQKLKLFIFYVYIYIYKIRGIYFIWKALVRICYVQTVLSSMWEYYNIHLIWASSSDICMFLTTFIHVYIKVLHIYLLSGFCLFNGCTYLQKKYPASHTQLFLIRKSKTNHLLDCPVFSKRKLSEFRFIRKIANNIIPVGRRYFGTINHQKFIPWLWRWMGTWLKQKLCRIYDIVHRNLL